MLPNGQLSYEQDANGNRITLGYNGQNQLVSLTYSNPSDPAEPAEQLTLSYNAQGFVSQEADGTGNIWTYNYDAAGHLLSVTAPGPTAAGLTTTYTYDTGNNPETANALCQSPTPRLRGILHLQSDNRPAHRHKPIRWEPDRSEFDNLHLPGPSRGHVHGFCRRPSHNLVQRSRPAIPGPVPAGRHLDLPLQPKRQPHRLHRRRRRRLPVQLRSERQPDADRQPARPDHTGDLRALGNLTSITDADGNTTQYGYSSNGNLLSITYPDGSQESFTYDPLGNLSETVEQNGDVINSSTTPRAWSRRRTSPTGPSNLHL